VIGGGNEVELVFVILCTGILSKSFVESDPPFVFTPPNELIVVIGFTIVVVGFIIVVVGFANVVVVFVIVVVG
jgi:hypothetical protein